mmetsp:Transcript_1555/g.2199  ORF Transcript_1555/g.2199 Transcript_1555/m.2199 type:complete len:215 (+) Transcript_1555:234-878(+)
MVAASLATNLAMAASRVKFSPLSLSCAARHVKSRAESRATAICDILFWIVCNDAMGLPKALRSKAYFTAQSIDAVAIPSACPATPIRPPSKVCMAILKPWPVSPNKLSLGIRTSSMIRLAVDEARMPSLSSLAPNENPGVSVGTINAEIPLCLSDLSVVANTIAADASYALVIHPFVPLITHSSPSKVAVVEAAPASLPFPGSLKPKQPSLSMT